MKTSSRVQADPGEQLAEQLPGGADERHALLVLVEAGRLARRTSGRRSASPSRTRPASGSPRAGSACSRRPASRVRAELGVAGQRLNGSRSHRPRHNSRRRRRPPERAASVGCLLVPCAANTENCLCDLRRPAVGARRRLVVRGRAPRSATRSSCRRIRRSASRLSRTTVASRPSLAGSCASAPDGTAATLAVPGIRTTELEPEMKTLRSIAELRRALEPLRGSGAIGLVPTMGALHDGHAALFDAARARVRRRRREPVRQPGAVRATRRDLAAYPRDLDGDERVAAAAGVDFLFAPAAGELYPPGFATWVEPGGRRRRPRGRAPARPLPRRRDRLREALQHRPARRRLLRPQGRAAGRGRQAGRPRPEPRARDPRRPDRPRRRRPRALVPQRPPLRRRARARARDPARARDRATPTARARVLAAAGSSPTTSRSPTSTAPRSRRRARRRHPPDRQRPAGRRPR